MESSVWANISNYIMFGVLGGPRIIPANIIVNIQKGGTFFYVWFLMYYFSNYSLGMYLYLALHGSYGILWLIKDFTFPDKNFKNKQTIGSSILLVIALLMYWYPAYLLASGNGIQEPSNSRFMASAMTYVFGSHFMMLADCQKYFVLQNKKGLISDGMFKLTRNPNYLGEVMIYLSFAMVTGNYISYVIFGQVWCTLFVVNMLAKETSFRQKKGWEEYSQRSSMFLFKIFKNDIVNAIFWALVALFLIYDYSVGGLIAHFKS